ncbi:hypothetical protein LWE69_19755 [Paenibacillus sp. UKAQ_18]|nr:hypothetical protein [Paenibacillus sp. UKAQ_18]
MLQWIENNVKTAIIAAIALAFVVSAGNYVLQNGPTFTNKLGPSFEKMDSK